MTRRKERWREETRKGDKGERNGEKKDGTNKRKRRREEMSKSREAKKE